MLHELSFLTLFFRLFNFALLFAIFYYLFKKYIKNQTEEKINQKESLLKGLEEQGYMLEGKQQELEIRHAAQEEKSVLLKGRLADWKKVIEREQQKNKEEFSLQMKAIAARVLEKNEHIKQDQFHKLVAPQVIELMRERLIKKFSDSQQASHYVHALVARLEEIK